MRPWLKLAAALNGSAATLMISRSGLSDVDKFLFWACFAAFIYCTLTTLEPK